MVLATDIAELSKKRTESHLRKIKAAVSSKPIVMRAECAHCPNLTVIDTPGFVIQALRGEPESLPDEILSMVKALAAAPHRLVLFLQQSSVEWGSSIWLETLEEIDPTFSRTIVVISKFDNRLKVEFEKRSEVDTFLSASGYLEDNIRPFFIALPTGRRTFSNEEFRRQIREAEDRGFDEEKYGSCIGFSHLKVYLESELHNRYRATAPATLELLDQRCREVSMDLARLNRKLEAMSDVSQLRRSAVLHVASICNHMLALLNRTDDPALGEWGKTTEEERLDSGIGGWPGINIPVKPTTSTLKLYGAAAFQRVVCEFCHAAYLMECTKVSKHEVGNVLFALDGRGGNNGLTEAAAQIAREAAQAWLAPLCDTACDRIEFVLQSLFDVALARNRSRGSQDRQNVEDMDGYDGFHAAVRRSYYRFVKGLSLQCKQKLQVHLASVTSCYSHICYGKEFSIGVETVTDSMFRLCGFISFDLSDSGSVLEEDQDNMPPKDQQHMTPPAEGNELDEVLRENQAITPVGSSLDFLSDVHGDKRKNNVIPDDHGPREKHARINRNTGVKSGASYSTICTKSAECFAKMRNALIETYAPSAFISGFLEPFISGFSEPWLFEAFILDLIPLTDGKFMDMFAAPGAVDALQNERHSLLERRAMLLSCLKSFEDISDALQ
ncbi:hypothetical protein U9M48_030277 [Paspalum notatum var. saurae]|uniref:Dynamin-type G domain-containing protein n=1 Tax=Paspalum notatum var. saurae TaxID=547442 RepID=A0AAQ3TZT9_PASNO